MQNQTSSLSVAFLSNRTSSPLESLNSILTRSIAKKTHFFRFVGRLKLFESKKAHDMCLAINSREKEYKPANKKYHLRDAKIRENTKLLDEGKIDVKQFLEEMSNDRNRMFTYYHKNFPICPI